MIDKKYISEIEAAQRYGYSRSWFQRARWQGDSPPFVKIRGKILFPVDVVDEWFESHGLRRSTSEKIKEGIN